MRHSSRLRAPLGRATLAVLIVVLGSGRLTAAGVANTAAFDVLRGLAGHWTGKSESGEPMTIDYAVAAHRSTLIETQAPGAADEMVTVYSLAGDDLVLTHYCPMGEHGNQPHMKLDRAASTPTDLRFSFVTLTNLDPAKDVHVHDGRIVILDADHIRREWEIYKDGRLSGTERFTLARAAVKP
jgi:hypothetical protein